MWQSLKVFNVFNTLTLIQIFWKTKAFFKKLEYRFSVETTKIENTSFPFKTALSEANVKTNRMATTEWTYHKEWSFASNCFILLENLFQFQNLLNRVNLMYQRPKCPYSHISLCFLYYQFCSLLAFWTQCYKYIFIFVYSFCWFERHLFLIVFLRDFL